MDFSPAATALYLEYKKQNLPAELHLFTKGGHGFGMRDNKQPINAWPQRCAEWMDAMGWMPTKAKLQSRIREHEAAMAALRPVGFVCMDDIPIMQNEIAKLEKEAAKAPNSPEVVQAQPKLASYKKALSEIQAKLQKVDIEKVIREGEAHKRAISELQATLTLLE